MTGSEIALTGLIGSRPIGALAAFGLLRWCQEIEALRGARLRWELEDDWIAVLDTPKPMDGETLCATLLAAHQAVARFEHLDWSADGKLRVPAGEFRKRCKANTEAAALDRRLTVDFDAAFGCECTVNKENNIMPTPFDMTGNKNFLNSIHGKLGLSFSGDGNGRRRKNLNSIQEALFGPWTYSDHQHPMGWDSDSVRFHAFTAQEPEKLDKNRSVRFAVWLAHYALPCFPSVPDKHRLVTVGFIRKKRGDLLFRWPIWEASLGLAAVTSLLAHRSLVGPDEDIASLYDRGVAAVYESIRAQNERGAAIFRPARLVEPRQVAAPSAAGPLII